MASDTSLVFNLVARDRVSAALGPVAAKLNSFGSKIGMAVAGVGVAAPYVAAAATAAGGLAAGAVAAGAAVGAFKAAVVPQLQAVAAASDVAAKAEAAHTKADLMKSLASKAATKGHAEYKTALNASASAAAAAKQADAAAAQQMALLPPATRATAVAFGGLKNDYKKWSDSLAGDTMPIFTRGIQGLRGVLPALTPLVKAAAGAIGGFVDDIARGAQSGGFKAWIADFAAAAGPALSNFLTVIKNLAVGIGSLLHAFLPVSAGMTGGLADMTGAFAKWAKGLEGSAGFAKFLDMADSGKGALGNLATALGQLLVDLAPFMGATTIIAQGLADIIAVTPTPVITLLAKAFIIASVGMKIYAAGAWIVATANAVISSSAWRVTAGWIRMNAMGLGVYARIAAGAVASAATTSAAWIGSALTSIGTWIATVVRAAITAVAQFALMAARAVIWAATMAAQWLIAMGPIGWIIIAVIAIAALIYANWDRIKKYTVIAWHATVNFVVAAAKRIWQFFLNWSLPGLIIKHWSSIKNGTIRVATATVNWVRGLPGMIAGAVSSLGSRIASLASRAWNSFRTNVINRAMSAVAWVRGLPGRIASALGNMGSLLVSKGRSVVQGLWSGIQSMGGWLRGRVMSWAKSQIPGPIAKALGISSPSKVTMAQGRWIARGLVDGLIGSATQVRKAATKLADIVRDSMAPGRRRNQALDRIGDDTARLVALANKQVTVAGKLKTAQKALADLQKSRAELVNSVKQSIMSAADITQGMGAGEAGTADSILQRLKQDVGAAQAFAADLNKLRKKGVDKDLIAQIAAAGVQGGAATATALANAGGGQIKAINDQQKALRKAAGAAGTAAGDAMYAAGIHAAEGLVKGLSKQEKAIENAMLRIAKSMSKAIRKALKISSPSALMADEVGQFVPPGLMAGVKNATPRMEADLQQWAATTVSGGVRSGTATMPAARPGAAPMIRGGQQQVRVVLDVRGGDGELKNLLRKWVRVDGGGNVQKALGTGKG